MVDKTRILQSRGPQTSNLVIMQCQQSKLNEAFTSQPLGESDAVSQ